MERIELEQLLTNFVKEVNEKTRFVVNFTVVNPKAPNLKDIAEICSKIFESDNFTGTCQSGNHPLYRQIFCKLAIDIGFTQNSIAKFLKKDRSTVAINNKKINNYLAVSDKKTLSFYNMVSTKIKEIYGNEIFDGIGKIRYNA